jgi:hypothetical protein
MKINGLTLPASFVQEIDRGTLGKRTQSLELRHLREELDAYGHHLETEMHSFYEDIASLQKETDALPKNFPPYDDSEEWDDDDKDEPGFVPYIKDFSEIVCFGMDGGAAPFCFDFRENPIEPSVIWWADVCWRRIAPNFKAFIELFPAP